jgi:WD40 repeat protein
MQPLLEHCGITKTTGELPRIQDLRHSFAVNALLRWYRAGADVEAKLPLLATYLGHKTSVHALAFNKDGTLLASGGRDGAARIWKLP